MQTIETHKVNRCNDDITITILDEPGQSGACHSYRVEWDDEKQDIYFQEGPISEVGVNGVTHEVLLAIVQHRLEGFQSGKVRVRRKRHGARRRKRGNRASEASH